MFVLWQSEIRDKAILVYLAGEILFGIIGINAFGAGFFWGRLLLVAVGEPAGGS